MKCEIIRDLLPSYVDKLTSNESNSEIEAHLNACSECEQIYENMSTNSFETVTAADTHFDEYQLITKIKKQLLLKKVLLITIPLLIIGITIAIITQVKFSAKLDQIDQPIVYELENGDLYAEIATPPGYNYCTTFDGTSDENYLLQKSQNLPIIFQLNFYTTIWDRISRHDLTSLGVNNWPIIIERGNLIEITGSANEFAGIAYGELDKPVGYLWKKGDSLKKATPEIEEKVKQIKNGTFEYIDN